MRYDLATTACATQNHPEHPLEIIIDNANANSRAILRFPDPGQDRHARRRTSPLKLAASQANQNSYLTATLDAQTNELIRRISPSPVPAYQVPNPYTGCCGYNNCGC